MALGDDILKERFQKTQLSTNNSDPMNTWEHLVAIGNDAGTGGEIDELWPTNFLLEPWSPEIKEEPESTPPTNTPQDMPNCAICNQTLGTYQGEFFCWSC